MIDEFDALLQDALSKVSFRDWQLVVGCDGARRFLQWSFRAPCARSGEIATRKCRKWWLSPYMTKSELVQTALMAALAAAEHETREAFLYNGEPVFGPHLSVDRLHSLCASGLAEEHRS